MGWWHMTYIGDNVYWLFYEYNLIDYRYNSSTNNWDIFFEEYWYTKYNNLYVLETDGWMHILEDKYSYDIRNDSLFLDGSFNGIRATSPFGI
ncbi:MAG: hypothetical protein LBL74_07825 [Bacteroidales bacterium]|nr:hypothetical protein [Bacteroidales bacterium]